MNGLQRHQLFLLVFFMIVCAGTASAEQGDSHKYIVKPGDRLSEIVVKFTGSTDYGRVAEVNGIADPDRIYPGETIRIAPTRPETVLRRYLEAIYGGGYTKAYGLLSPDSRGRISQAAFEGALQSVTLYDLDSIRLCSEFVKHGRHIAQIAIDLKEDPAKWGFNLAWEDNKWRVLLYDQYPAFPHYDGIIDWRCNLNK